MIKVLNLYAGIGGNRKLWKDVEVTAIENDPEIAKIYKDFFPQDKVIVTDAHNYLLKHYQEFDFIWSSPPCPSHSRIRKVFSNQNKPIYPSMALYEEILFLKGYFKGNWVVENVISWYDPLIEPYESGSHYFWSNFYIPVINKIKNNPIRYWTYKEYEKKYGYDLSNYKLNGFDKRKILRNCVEPQLGKNIIEQLKLSRITIKNEQYELFSVPQNSAH